MSLKRRIFTKEFKQQIIRKVQAGKSIAQASGVSYAWASVSRHHQHQSYSTSDGARHGLFSAITHYQTMSFVAIIKLCLSRL